MMFVNEILPAIEKYKIRINYDLCPGRGRVHASCWCYDPPKDTAFVNTQFPFYECVSVCGDSLEEAVELAVKEFLSVPGRIPA